jgi:hypothetical protein
MGMDRFMWFVASFAMIWISMGYVRPKPWTKNWYIQGGLLLVGMLLFIAVITG